MDDLAFALQSQRALKHSQFSQQLSSTSQQFLSQGSQSSQGGSPRPSGEPPLCKCGARAARFQVKKETANKGRWFYNWNTDRCDFYQWADNGPSFNSPQRLPGQGRATGTSSQLSFDHQQYPQLSPPWPAQLSFAQPVQLSPGQPQLSTHQLQQAPSSSLPVACQLPFSIQGGGPGLFRTPLQNRQAMSPSSMQPAVPFGAGFGGGSMQITSLEFQRRKARKAALQQQQQQQQRQQQPQHVQAQMLQQAQQQALAQEVSLQQEQQQQLYGTEVQQRFQPALAQQEELFQQQEQEHLLLLPVSATSPPPSACKPPKGITVVLEMEGSDRFMARSKYHEDMPGAIKSTNRRVTDYKWDRDRKAWSFAVAGYAEVVRAMKMDGFTVDELPSELLGGGPAAPKLPSYRLSQYQIPQRVPESLWNRLPLQKEGVQFILSTQGWALLADEMDLGKSMQALAAAAAYFPQMWPLLIICPSSLRFMWADAVRNWLPAEMQPAPADLWVISSIYEFNKVSKQDVPTNRPHVCITSYDLVQKMDGLERQYRFIIADESHALKSPQAKRTDFVGCLLQSQAHQADRRALLITGTPVLSRPIEIWSQVDCTPLSAASSHGLKDVAQA